MPQNVTVTAPSGVWTQLTDANVTNITFQNVSAPIMLIKGTVGATAPTDTAGALNYERGQGERNVALADLFPGVSGVNRVWAYASNGAQGSVMVSHA